MPNFKLDISYDGTDFHGWQIQKNKRSIQGDLTSAFKKISKTQKINIIGSGRTDSGVHANHQIANIKINTKLSPLNIMNAINSYTREDIHINSCKIVDDNFNARFSALKREYLYIIDENYSPFNRNYSWVLNYNTNYKLLNECANMIKKNKNFSSFCKLTSLKENNECIIFHSKWILNQKRLNYVIVANRFLHHMVRFLIGTMIEVSKGKNSLKNFETLLTNKKINNAIIKAPPQGLYLNNVYYE